MKYLKLFEEQNRISYSNLKHDIIEAVRDIEDDFGPGINNDEYFKGCPFIDELLLLHQKGYIKDVYWNSMMEWNISLMEFHIEYNLMIDESKKKIISELEKNTDLYTKYGKYIEELGVDVPDWVVGANKYNL